MILTAHQPTYLPWCGLFHKIALADHFVVYDDVPMDHVEKWEQRNYIKAPDGLKLRLTVPVQGSRETPIRELRVDNNQPWQRKHWRSLELAYHKAPYWNRYSDYFSWFYLQEWRTLADLDTELLRWILGQLGLFPVITMLSDLNIPGEKSERVLNLCLELGANAYIFGEQGKDYADEDAFEDAGVRIIYQEYRHPRYEQLRGEFVSHLSVVDLLFNHGPASLDILMEKNLKREDLR